MCTNLKKSELCIICVVFSFFQTMDQPPASANTEKVALLQNMFENVKLDTVKRVLDEEDGVVERAIDSLLNLASLEPQTDDSLSKGT